MIKVSVNLNSIEMYLLEAYCYGKGILWNLFFGWRKTIFTDGDTPINTVIYKISAKDWRLIRELARECVKEKARYKE